VTTLPLAAGPSSATTPAGRAAGSVGGTSEELQNKFSLVVLTSQRARQLQNGARPRVDPDGHKFPWVARHEVMAGMISWDVLPKPAQGQTPR